MKKIIYIIAAICCLYGCSTDLSDIEERIKELEDRNSSLTQENDRLNREKQNQDNKINELEDSIRRAEERWNTVEPKLTKFEFVAEDNPMQLVENTTCEIVGDSVVECWIVNITTDKTLIPRFEFDGEKLTLDGKDVTSGVTAHDFKKTVTLTVSTPQKSKSYNVYVHSYTGLPVLWVETTRREDISSTSKFYNATFKLAQGVTTRAAGDVIQSNVRIKSDGDLRWYYTPLDDDAQMAKNPYWLQFSSEMSLLDEASSRNWNLITNSKDNTMLRVSTGYYLSQLSNLAYTPKYHFVELMLNGIYYGTYMLGDRIENITGRADVGFGGYILQVGRNATGNPFNISNFENQIGIITPSVNRGSQDYNYIVDYLDETEEVLFGSNFTDPDNGWQKYLDIDSFVDWYLVNEIAKNEEAEGFKSNCYMMMRYGDKLKMGPVWNTQFAFGNSYGGLASGFVVKNTKVFARLFQDPAFVSKVKERFDYFYSQQTKILTNINANAQYLRRSVVENDNKWDVFEPYKSSTHLPTSVLYQNEVQLLKEWVTTRMEWLKHEFAEL